MHVQVIHPPHHFVHFWVHEARHGTDYANSDGWMVSLDDLIGCLACSDMVTSSFDPFMATNGLLGGLVAITASSPMVETEGSFVIGFLSGFLVFYGSKLLLSFKVSANPKRYSVERTIPPVARFDRHCFTTDPMARFVCFCFTTLVVVFGLL